ncbi:hypothetical protein FD754_017854 [Muntiacus muntjak]|uniref:G-protein coupled receptors family 1 profile domain-containing protein n=1 Tax=Muntiacus muntjak TaxID=9888 RepID=A0A5N3VV40_MUNMU|nr:hypothetical protein FD754_017854 [Muntiacus muntjak]
MFARSPALNQPGPTEFVSRAFTSAPGLQAPLSVLFLVLYLMTLRGNTAVTWVVCTHSPLHTPMYSFLCDLSFLDICCTTVVVPLMLCNILGARKPIPLAGCGAQMFFFVTLGSAACFLLAVTAYERHAATRHPLHSTRILTRELCVRLAGCAAGLPSPLPAAQRPNLHPALLRAPPRHQPPPVRRAPVPRPACADPRVRQAALHAAGSLVLAVPFLISASHVLTGSVLRARSAAARRRAFSACSPHLAAVPLQDGCCSLDEDRQIALTYTFATPLLNPLIYTLRNKDGRGALKNAFISKAASDTT